MVSRPSADAASAAREAGVEVREPGVVQVRQALEMVRWDLVVVGAGR